MQVQTATTQVLCWPSAITYTRLVRVISREEAMAITVAVLEDAGRRLEQDAASRGAIEKKT